MNHLIPLPSDPEAIAAACNIELIAGVAQITQWGGSVVVEHAFGRPIICGLLVEVFGRDEAFARQYKPETPRARERHLVTISSAAFPQGR